jgi:hypothetical protein
MTQQVVKDKRGRLSMKRTLERFFARDWTLEEAQTFAEGAKSIRPDNVRLLALIELQKDASQVEV